MVNNMWNWTSTPYNPDVPVIVQEWIDRRRAEQRALARQAWVWDLFDVETQNLRIAQEQVDATRIEELRTQIASWEGTLWSMARIWIWMSIVPDSIDEVWPRHEYTKEDAQKYLDELNKKYPIKEVLGQYFWNFLRGESQHIFQMSFTWDAGIERNFYDLIKKSAEAWKWVSALTPRWWIDYIRNVNPNDEKTKSVLENDALWFFDAYPEAHKFLEDYEKSIFDINLLNMFKRTWRLLQMNFEMWKIMRTMDEYSRWILENRIAKIHQWWEYSYELLLGIFPKEHLIKDLMRRLWTSISSDLQIEQK